MQNGIIKELVNYNTYDALQNSAKIWFMLSPQIISNCWKKTGIFLPNNEDEDVFKDDFIFNENTLISLFPKGDLNAQEYIHIEDKAAEGELTDNEIIDTILNVDREEEHIMDKIEFVLILEKVSLVEAENAIDKIIRFLYEQEVEFGKQDNIQDYFNDNI
ncbi:16231_t:CDS:2 [Funneliformis mosseae]|uniref:16231_t:CDS:1 n=1 Tax=Funneliformis mosseae TaxID=27381 RepID=A0A9N9F7N6_FUNMO|nr:16231_t:CDS:2 [Funneliformis mosseae]